MKQLLLDQVRRAKDGVLASRGELRLAGREHLHAGQACHATPHVTEALNHNLTAGRELEALAALIEGLKE